MPWTDAPPPMRITRRPGNAAAPAPIPVAPIQPAPIPVWPMPAQQSPVVPVPSPGPGGPRPVAPVAQQRSGFPSSPRGYEERDEGPHLSVRPLRTPAPAVTTIRVAPVPVDGFEYETASLWFSDPQRSEPVPTLAPEPPPLPPPMAAPAPRRNSYVYPAPTHHHDEAEERPSLSWLDE
jgi:hypothetical protein